MKDTVDSWRVLVSVGLFRSKILSINTWWNNGAGRNDDPGSIKTGILQHRKFNETVHRNVA